MRTIGLWINVTDRHNERLWVAVELISRSHLRSARYVLKARQLALPHIMFAAAKGAGKAMVDRPKLDRFS